jgi:hypothetical protein
MTTLFIRSVVSNQVNVIPLVVQGATLYSRGEVVGIPLANTLRTIGPCTSHGPRKKQYSFGQYYLLEPARLSITTFPLLLRV